LQFIGFDCALPGVERAAVLSMCGPSHPHKLRHSRYFLWRSPSCRARYGARRWRGQRHQEQCHDQKRCFAHAQRFPINHCYTQV